MKHLEDGPEGEYLTDRLTDEAVTFLKKDHHKSPWFLDLSYYAPHTLAAGKLEAKSGLQETLA